MPQAIKFMQRSAQDLAAIDPKYFDRFHASAETKSASKAIDRYPFLCLYHAFIQHENFHHENIARGSFSPAVCLQLHQTEAKVLHELKAHLELLAAYRWHQISARRQESSFQKLRNGELQGAAMLVQFDFKENVRYPVSCSSMVSIRFFRFNTLVLDPLPLQMSNPKPKSLTNKVGKKRLNNGTRKTSCLLRFLVPMSLRQQKPVDMSNCTSFWYLKSSTTTHR